MRSIVMGYLLLVTVVAKPQPSDSFILFSGYVMDQDSLPVENALLVNFRTLKPTLTNEKGFFSILLMSGDSLLINHISYERKIIKANNLVSHSNKYYLHFSPYELKAVNIKYRDIEMENLHKNMKLIYAQLNESTPDYKKGSTLNSYAPPSKEQVFGISLNDIYNLIVKKKNKRKK